MGKNINAKALLLTVGTGRSENIEQTLITPLKKSIEKGEWSVVVLLPSRRTLGNAEALGGSHPAIRVLPLDKPGQEENADDCYAHFDRVISSLLEEGYSQDDIVPDFTRGTKVMSAALVLASIRHGLPMVRYITGERDSQGMVQPGTERIVDVSTLTAVSHRQLDRARSFFERGDFEAALEVLPRVDGPLGMLYPEPVRQIASFFRPVAEFYGRWDRLDYRAARNVRLYAEYPAQTPGAWKRFVPTAEMVEWVNALAEPRPAEPSAMAMHLRRLSADLLANGERRIRDGQYEDAVLRAYRVLEMIGQIHLFERGLDTEKLPPDNEYIIQLREKLSKEGRSDFGRRFDGTLTAPRELAARLLKQMGDPFGKRLLQLGESGQIKANSRNMSVLIHGYDITGFEAPEILAKHYQALEKLLEEDDPGKAGDRLTVARVMNFVK